MPTLSTATYDSICSVTLNSTQNIITFGNLPMNYDEFIVTLSGPYSGAAVYYARYTSGTYYGQYDPSSYTYQYIVQTPTTGTASYGVSAATSKGFVNLSSGSTTTHTTLELNLNLHTQNLRIAPVIANARQYATSVEGYGGLGTTAYRSDGFLNDRFMLWWDLGGWGAGTVINLYGLRASSLKAQGGNWITAGGGYLYHLFTSSGTFTPVANMSADVLVIAGGGAGGGSKGGGGGSGGACAQTSRSLTGGTSYTVTIGAGGVGANDRGANGSNTVFDTITALGGGGGGSDFSTLQSGNSGGCGGGATRGGTVGSATQGNSGGATGHGFAGGAGSNGTYNIFGGGGGGGIGGAGGVPTTTGTKQAGAGGTGGTTWTSWFNNFPSLMGHSDTPGGGGGGSSYSSGENVLGGEPGSNSGGTGASYNTTLTNQQGFPAIANSGGGGGGGSSDSGNRGGNGASGLVIVRYSI